MESRLGRVHRRSLGGDAADLIRTAILTGGFAPGTPLREVELAAELGVSRGSVRDGLARLAVEGLVTTGWHQVTRVVEITAADVREVYALRQALDGLAAVTALPKADAAGVDGLLRVVSEMATEIQDGGDPATLVRLDLQFHDGVYALAGNGRLTAAWQTLRSQVHLFQLRRVREGYLPYRDRVVQEHREIAELLRDGTGGDAERLERTAREHVAAAERSLLAGLSRAGG